MEATYELTIYLFASAKYFVDILHHYTLYQEKRKGKARMGSQAHRRCRKLEIRVFLFRLISFSLSFDSSLSLLLLPSRLPYRTPIPAHPVALRQAWISWTEHSGSRHSCA